MTSDLDGSYIKGHEATVSIEKELPADGFMGALGGRRIFVAWRSPQGIESKDPTFTFAVQQPTTLRAGWRADDSMPITILSALGIIIIAALAVFVLYSRGVFKSKAAKAEPTELEKAKAEIERLKQEQEERPAKRRPVRKKKPPPPAAETTST
jgi:nucleoid-associated protein YgaU